MKRRAPFSIIYEDDYILAVNKAAGITVGADRWDGSRERLDKLVAALRAPGKPGGIPRVLVVHRIDRDTSGLVVFARDEETHRRLSAAFESRRVVKRYYGAVHGRPSWTETCCELPLVPDGDKQHRTIIDRYRGKPSRTRFRLLGSAGPYSILEALPETGRTHQIRVHCTSLGHPIVCDPLYGKARDDKGILLSSFKRDWRGDLPDEKPLIARLGLHAAELVLPDYGAENEGENTRAPAGNRTLRAPLPRDLAALIRQMEKSAGTSFGVVG
jgi:23S rRNA pseudouridine1911/1915/1917 synthase